MDEPHTPQPNPFSSPKTSARIPEPTRPVHPMMLVVFAGVSLFAGGCAFFFTCLGVAVLGLFDSGIFEWLLLFAVAVSLVAMVGTMRLCLRRARRPENPSPIDLPNTHDEIPPIELESSEEIEE